MWHDTTAADDKALQERGLANSTEKEATFLFDSSMTCAQWLQKGKDYIRTGLIHATEQKNVSNVSQS